MLLTFKLSCFGYLFLFIIFGYVTARESDTSIQKEFLVITVIIEGMKKLLNLKLLKKTIIIGATLEVAAIGSGYYFYRKYKTDSGKECFLQHQFSRSISWYYLPFRIPDKDPARLPKIVFFFCGRVWILFVFIAREMAKANFR